MATFKQRGNSWRVSICVGGVRESSTHDTKQEAKEWAERRSTEIRDGARPVAGGGAQGTLHALLQNVKLTKTTLSRTRRSGKAEECRISRMQNHSICNKVVRKLTETDFIQYKQDRESEGVTLSTIRRELNIVGAALNELVELRQLVVNPLAMIMKKLPKDREIERLLSEDEVSRFEDAYERLNCKRTKNRWLFWAFLFAGETGLRKAELVALLWTDVDTTKRVAVVHQVDDLPDSKGGCSTPGTKNGDHCREIPLSPTALAILSCIPRAIDPKLQNRVFPTSYNALNCAFQRLKRRVGILDFRWHDLRHMAATSLLARLRNVAYVAAVTGHKDWKSLQRYVHPKATDIAKILAEV